MSNHTKLPKTFEASAIGLKQLSDQFVQKYAKAISAIAKIEVGLGFESTTYKFGYEKYCPHSLEQILTRVKNLDMPGNDLLYYDQSDRYIDKDTKINGVGVERYFEPYGQIGIHEKLARLRGSIENMLSINMYRNHKREDLLNAAAACTYLENEWGPDMREKTIDPYLRGSALAFLRRERMDLRLREKAANNVAREVRLAAADFAAAPA
jgi:hypothetical protein